MEEIGSDPFSQLRSQAFVHVLTARGVNLYITMGGTDIGKFSDFLVMGTQTMELSLIHQLLRDHIRGRIQELSKGAQRGKN